MLLMILGLLTGLLQDANYSVVYNEWGVPVHVKQHRVNNKIIILA